MSLYKTTLIIWSEFNPTGMAIDDLATEAVNGSAYCAKKLMEEVEVPRVDKDWVVDGERYLGTQDDVGSTITDDGSAGDS